MRFKGLDLNLLVALQALLDERSVSRTARRLGLSQPAVSAGLSRLRAYFDDELLVPAGRQMLPTPYAESLRPAVNDLVAQAERLVASPSAFDPALSARRFRIGTLDFFGTALVAPLLHRVEREAPGIRLEILPTGSALIPQFERGDIDLILAPEHYVVPDHPSETLFSERHVVLGWSGNPAMNGPMTPESFDACGHVAVHFGPLVEPSYAERQLRDRAARRVEIVIPSFSALPWVLANSRRVAVVRERIARTFCEIFPLVVRPLPFPMAPLREMVHYHAARADDAGVKWLLDQLRRVSEETAPA